MRTHLVFTNGRSGSNFVADAINQHPALCNYGEVLGSYMPTMKLHRAFRYGGRDVEAYLNYVLTSRRHFELAKRYSALARRRRGDQPRDKRWRDLESIGVKDFGIRFSEHNLDDYLARHPEISVISLHRENTLERAVSVISLERTGTVKAAAANGSTGATRRSQLEIDPSELISLMSRMDREMERQLHLVAGLDPGRVISLRYEEVFATASSPADTMRGVFEFLGVQPVDIQAAHRKVLSKDLSKTVSNFEEVADMVSRSRFADLLVDGSMTDTKIGPRSTASTPPPPAGAIGSRGASHNIKPLGSSRLAP